MPCRALERFTSIPIMAAGLGGFRYFMERRVKDA
jgi:hypothetical protein